ncbi:MAG TPA: hypothetical protein VGJ94_08425 [Syntrophorhabdaceae bacterium]|jgi:uncharacterized surface protein with fasciclin (FAS1) repeats
MKRRKSVAHWTGLAVFCLIAALAASCKGGPEHAGETAPLVDAAAKLIYSYEMVDHGKEAPAPEDLKPLGNSRWLVTSINPKPAKAYASMIFSFRSDGNLVETTVYEDRSEKSQSFPYHIVGSTLLINRPKGNVNARFKIEGTLLVIDTGDSSLLLQRMKN